MKFVIIGRTEEESNTFLELLLMNESTIKEHRKNRIIMKNNDSYHAIFLTNMPRCCRCDRIYINKNIDELLLKEIIYPMVRFSKLPEHERIIKWG
jgi:hypothetical protein